VDDDRAVEALRPAQRRLDRLEVVAVDRPHVLDAQVLEHGLRRDRVLDPLLDRVQHLEHRLADQRRGAQRLLDQVEHLLVAGVQPQGGQVVGQPADGRSVRAAVVVDHDDHRVAGGGDVVQRLPAHAAGERTVADDGDDVALLAAQRERLGHAVGVRQRGGGVRVLDDVMLALRPAGVAGQAAALAELVEAGLPTGHDLVHVRLVPGVEEEPVVRRIEDPVHGQGQLDHTEVRPEVAAGAGHLGHQKVPDLTGEGGQLVERHSLEVLRATDRVKNATVRDGYLVSAHDRPVYPGEDNPPG
jgi:hypothetical protein